LVSGNRTQVLSVDLLYGGAGRDPDWKEDLPYCDCEVLMDRAYFLPLGDASWPDDTRVQFEFMDGAQDLLDLAGATKAQVRAGLGEAVPIDFASGYEVWVYREKPGTELVFLFSPSGTLAAARVR
jgi:hypothetical protein